MKPARCPLCVGSSRLRPVRCPLTRRHCRPTALRIGLVAFRFRPAESYATAPSGMAGAEFFGLRKHGEMARRKGHALRCREESVSAQSGGMAVKVGSLGNILCLLRRHFCGIGTTRHSARSELSSGHFVLGQPFFFAGRAVHLVSQALQPSYLSTTGFGLLFA